MKSKIYQRVRNLFVVAVMLAACSKDDAVTESDLAITSITPNTGAPGDLVAIVGKGFSAQATDNIVKFNGVPANVVFAQADLLSVMVPDGGTSGPVTVTVGSSMATGPEFLYKTVSIQTYFITFKVNGVTKSFETTNPGFQSCGQCACATVPLLNEARNADLSFCQANNDFIEASDILSWNAKTINFDPKNVYPVANFNFTENNEYFSTSNATTQSGSKVSISSVVADAVYLDVVKSYKVTGTFQCKVAKSGGADVAITEGTFVLRFSEDY